jgi:hypothetical protein
MKNRVLTDFEQARLDEFKQAKQRTDEEVDEFIKILLALRERADKNPQLKAKG